MSTWFFVCVCVCNMGIQIFWACCMSMTFLAHMHCKTDEPNTPAVKSNRIHTATTHIYTHIHTCIPTIGLILRKHNSTTKSQTFLRSKPTVCMEMYIQQQHTHTYTYTHVHLHNRSDPAQAQLHHDEPNIHIDHMYRDHPNESFKDVGYA